MTKKTIITSGCSITLLLHLIYLNTPFVNLEYVFAEASKFFLDSSYKQGIQVYWENQANPLGYSLISALLIKLFNLPLTFGSFRVSGVLGQLLLLICGGICFSEKKEDHTKLFLWIALTALNPLIWIYSGRAMAETLPLGLLALSLLLCWKSQHRSISIYLSSIIFGVAILCKVHVALFSPVFCWILFEKNNRIFPKTLFQLVQFAFLPALMLAAYFTAIFQAYDILFIPEWAKKALPLQPLNFLKILSQYSLFLIFLLGPVSLYSVFHLFKKLSLRAHALVFCSGVILALLSIYISPSEFGEMNYGAFDRILPRPLIILISVTAGVLFSYLLRALFYEFKTQKQGIAAVLFFTLTGYLIVCSMTRPAQRYLIFLLPPIYFFLVNLPLPDLKFASHINRILGWGTVVFSVLLNCYAISYQVSTATAAHSMALWIQKENLIQTTAPGSIKAHSGQYFYPETGTEKTLYVTTTANPEKKTLHQETAQFWIKTFRTYYLLEN